MQRRGFNLTANSLMTDFFYFVFLSKAEKKLLGQLQHTPNTPPTLNLQVSVPLKWLSYKRLKKYGQLRHMRRVI